MCFFVVAANTCSPFGVQALTSSLPAAGYRYIMGIEEEAH